MKPRSRRYVAAELGASHARAYAVDDDKRTIVLKYPSASSGNAFEMDGERYAK